MDEKRIIELENRLRNLEQSSVVDRSISELDKRVINDVVQDGLDDILWNGTAYISSFATSSLTTTTAELFDSSLISQGGRESDTSEGKRFRPETSCRFKTAFYLNAGIPKSTVYIVAPAISTSTAIGTSIIDVNKSFVGVKIVAGVMSLVASTNGGVTTRSTSITIPDAITHLLEIDYYVTHAVVLFDNVIIGDIPCYLPPTTIGTFFPFLTSIGSSDGTSVNVTLENYEFLQRRK